MATIEQLAMEAADVFEAAGLADFLSERREAYPAIPRVSIVAGPNGHSARVLLNGVDISAFIDRYEVHGDVREPVSVTLHMPFAVVDGYFQEATVLNDAARSYWLRPWWKRLFKIR